MKYITPKTQDFTKAGTPWELKPPEGKTWELQAVTMTFDENIKYDEDSADMVVKVYANGVPVPVAEHRYGDLIDWIENATTHTRYDGLLGSSIHKFYINFGEKLELGDSSILSHLTIEMEDGQPIRATGGGVAKRARGQYIISES